MQHDDDTDDHSDTATTPTSPTVAKESFRKRSSRACDQCRKAKSRCDPSDDGPCKSCQLSGITCTFQGPSQKRGPPKGYLQALENRLHEAEALLGAIISSPQAEPLVAILLKDPLAEKIITRVNNSVFGALGRPRADKSQSNIPRGRRRPDKEQQRMSNGQLVYSRESGGPVFTSPSYAWQDHLNEQLADGSSSGSTSCSQAATLNGNTTNVSQWDRRQKRRTDPPEPLRLELPPHPHPILYSEPSEDIHSEPQPLYDFGVGKLSLDSYQQVRYHGEASGLTLLAQTPRTDTIYHQQIWRLPQLPVYRLGVDTRPVTYEDLEREAVLPARSVQEHLLRQYFHYVHPILPIVNRDEFWDDWTSMHKFGSGGPAKLLMLAMFALAARYTEPESQDQTKQSLIMAGSNYCEAAKSLLNQTYNSSRLSTCQALLLLGYREIGLSGIVDAALFTVMAIQMAQDLGLHRHADQWARDGSCVFSQRRLQLRRSVWYGCIVLDAYVAAQSGRPLHIRSEDYDTQLPEIDVQEDFQIWMPYRSAPASQRYNPLPGRITSCFRSLCLLAQIFSTILHKFYAVNSDWSAAQTHTGYFEIDQKLQLWYMELPDALRFTATPVPPPQILCLHMFYWCAVLLLQRTLIKTQLRSQDPQLSSRRALDLGAAAANNLTNIVHTYSAAFGLQHCPTLLTYYLMTAGVMHITILHMHPADVQATLGLNRCLQSLTDMKDTWPAASQIYAFLGGANVDEKDQPPTTPSDRSRKRALDESPSGDNRTSARSESVSSVPASVGMGVFHPTSYMELTHSLGLEPSGIEGVFGSSGYTAGTWPSGDVSFEVM